MTGVADHTPTARIRSSGRRLNERDSDHDELLELAGTRRFILLGEASHGTEEFYRMRAQISRRLISEQVVDAVAVEGDYPDLCRVNGFVRGLGEDTNARDALGDFQRFPRWMWRNQAMLDFVDWLRDFNAGMPTDRQTGIYGLDLYSLYRSADAVISYLERTDPEAAELARRRYECLDHVHSPEGDGQAYGAAVAMGKRRPCEREALTQLLDLLHLRSALPGGCLEDEHFDAIANGMVVRNAEAYYRGMYAGRTNTWNLRDQHMADTLFALDKHLSACRQRPARILVWAHNSHLGNARATDMGRRGELNLGQLVRDQAGEQALLAGMTTYTGLVTAVHDWGDQPSPRRIRPAINDSYERLFAETRLDRFFLPLTGPDKMTLPSPMLERAIGVIYRPHTERQSHYFHAHLSDQFDCLYHLDETRALEPLDDTPGWRSREEPPDTWPTGL